MINVALIGLGRIGQMHAENLFYHKSFNLKYTFDINTKLKQKLSKKFNSTSINNPQIAFKDKTDKDLSRAYFLFKTISNPFISKTLTVFVKIALFFKLPISGLIKATVYKHFCGGTTIEDSQKTIDKLWKSHIGTILDFSAEGKETKEDFNRAMNETIASIKKAKIENSIPFSVFKPTGLARFSLLEKISNNLELSENERLEKSAFDTFCISFLAFGPETTSTPMLFVKFSN